VDELGHLNVSDFRKPHNLSHYESVPHDVSSASLAADDDALTDLQGGAGTWLDLRSTSWVT
jgi:hypothetical protein